MHYIAFTPHMVGYLHVRGCSHDFFDDIQQLYRNTVNFNQLFTEMFQISFRTSELGSSLQNSKVRNEIHKPVCEVSILLAAFWRVTSHYKPAFELIMKFRTSRATNFIVKFLTSQRASEIRNGVWNILAKSQLKSTVS